MQNTLPRIQFPGKIHLINNDQELAAVAADLNSAKALGFDTETRAAFKVGEVYKVALLQLATDHEAYLIRLHGIQNFDSIKSVFENENILKVGVAIRDDIKQLQKLFSFTPKNFIELQSVAKEKGLKNMGLRGMTEEVLQASLSKRAKTSNWEVRNLTEEQIMYAATDAWIGLQLYQAITKASSVDTVKVVTFQSRYLKDYVSLNREWIRTYFEIEEMDIIQLENPHDSILKTGGEIFFILENEEAVGTCAMIPHGPKSFELAKMAISTKHRGKGYGDLLMTSAIQWAKDKGANSITLLSNTILEPAIRLYLKHGFQVKHQGTHPDYKRCNIEMEFLIPFT